MPAPGRTGRRGLDRERLAALPVARLRLRPGSPASRRRGSRTPSRRTRWRSARTASYVRAARRTSRAARTVARRGRRDAGRARRGHGLRHGRPLQPGLRRRDAPGRGARRAEVRRDPARGRGVVRRQRLRQAHRPPCGLLRHRRPGLDEPAHRPVRRQAGRLARCSPCPGRCRRTCWAAARSRTSTCRPCSATSSVWNATVTTGSDPAELAALAVKHAVDGRGVAHLVFPDEVQVQASEAAAAVPAGRIGNRLVRPDADALAAAADALQQREAAGDRRRPRRAARAGRGGRTRRAARRTGAHYVQGQGPGARHPPARRRRARPQRHSGGELADERVGPAGRGRGVVLATTPASRRTSRSCRSTTSRRPSAASTR